jgi:hypothetical protein
MSIAWSGDGGMKEQMKKALRVCKWILVNAAVLAVLIYGLHGYHKAWNVFVFFQWFTTIVLTLLYCAKDAPFVKDYPPPTFPGWVEFVYDFGIALGLAAFGHFFYAALSMTQFYLLQAFYSHKQKLEAK